MLKIDDRQIDRLEKDLKRLKKRALIPAMQDALNDTAFDAMRGAKDNVKQQMITRNTWTQRSIGVNKATFKSLQSAAGSREPYMRQQEEGAQKVAKGRHGVPIPTTEASGEPGAKVRRKVTRKPNRMSNIKLRGRKGKNRKQRNLLAVKRAASGKGSRFAFLDLGRRKGIFRVYGGKRKPRPRMVQDLTQKTISTPQNRWLEPAADKARKKMPSFYAKRLEIQLRRAGIFRG